MHRVNRSRRYVLRGGVAAASLFLPLPHAWVWAQSDGAVKLVRAPKAALVLGNSDCRSAPTLRNPVNIIILDACRENPFERDFRVSNKGLTQMDAPNDTLLA